MPEDNLWGELPQKQSGRTPLSIVREQAGMLGEWTNSKLMAEVVPGRPRYRVYQVMKGSIWSESVAQLIRTQTVGTPRPKPERFVADMDIIAPSLKGYRVTILQIEYPLTLYPAILRPVLTDDETTAVTEEDFVEKLKGILSSSEVREAIAGLLSQVQE